MDIDKLTNPLEVQISNLSGVYLKEKWKKDIVRVCNKAFNEIQIKSTDAIKTKKPGNIYYAVLTNNEGLKNVYFAGVLLFQTYFAFEDFELLPIIEKKETGYTFYGKIAFKKNKETIVGINSEKSETFLALTEENGNPIFVEEIVTSHKNVLLKSNNKYGFFKHHAFGTTEPAYHRVGFTYFIANIDDVPEKIRNNPHYSKARRTKLATYVDNRSFSELGLWVDRDKICSSKDSFPLKIRYHAITTPFIKEKPQLTFFSYEWHTKKTGEEEYAYAIPKYSFTVDRMINTPFVQIIAIDNKYFAFQSSGFWGMIEVSYQKQYIAGEEVPVPNYRTLIKFDKEEMVYKDGKFRYNKLGEESVVRTLDEIIEEYESKKTNNSDPKLVLTDK